MLQHHFLMGTVVFCAEESHVWTTVGADGRSLNAGVVELGAEDREDELIVEVHNEQDCVARGSIPMVDLWQVGHSCLLYSGVDRATSLNMGSLCMPCT